MVSERASPDATVGIIGLGSIGLAAAERLVEIGRSVVGFDVAKTAHDGLVSVGGSAAATPKEVADRARTILVTVPNTPHILQALEGAEGLAQGLTSDSTLVIMSTVDQATPAMLAERLEPLGVGVLDAALSGGPDLARSGRLALMVGGSETQLDEVRPILEQLAADIVHVGPHGHGQIAKLAHNLVGIATVIGLAEGLALASKAGADVERVAAAIGAGTASNRILAEWLPRTVFANDYSPRFSLDLMRKDIALIHEVAARLGIAIPILELGAEVFDRASAEGHGREDFSVVIDLRAREVGAPLGPNGRA